MPFILSTAMLYCLGLEYTGLGGLFASILDVLNLAELGVGSVTVFSYWMFAYRNCLFQSFQKAYVSTRIELRLNVIFSILQLLSLLIFANYYIYLLINLIRQIVGNINKAIVSEKCFRCMIQEEKWIRKKKRLFGEELGIYSHQGWEVQLHILQIQLLLLVFKD